jgi:hypothetical protein
MSTTPLAILLSLLKDAIQFHTNGQDLNYRLTNLPSSAAKKRRQAEENKVASK